MLSVATSGDMGPAPLLDPPDWDSHSVEREAHWETHSVESRYTEESKVGFDTQVTELMLEFKNIFKLRKLSLIYDTGAHKYNGQ